MVAIRRSLRPHTSWRIRLRLGEGLHCLSQFRRGLRCRPGPRAVLTRMDTMMRFCASSCFQSICRFAAMRGPKNRRLKQRRRQHQSTTPATYVGTETCAGCHEDIGKAIAKNPHEAVDRGESKHGFKGQACESCHGPGSNHAQTLSAADIRNPAKLAPAEVDRTCMTCHRNQPTTSGRLEASHAHNDIACTSCHSIPTCTWPGESWSRANRIEINAQCEGCHFDVKAAFAQALQTPGPGKTR